jgi:hypothetical protein
MGRRAEPLLVEPAEAIAARAAATRELRSLWRRTRLEMAPGTAACTVAERLCLAPDWLLAQLANCGTFGVLQQAVELWQAETGGWTARWPHVPIERAIHDLRARLAPLRAAPSGSLALEEVEAVERLAAAD